MPAVTVLFSHPIFLESLEEAAFLLRPMNPLTPKLGRSLDHLQPPWRSNSPNLPKWRSYIYICINVYIYIKIYPSLLILLLRWEVNWFTGWAHLQTFFGWEWNQQHIRTMCTPRSQCQPKTTRRPNVYDPNPESCSTIHQSDKFGHFRQRVGETIKKPLLFPSVAKQISSSQIHHLACGTPTEMWQEKRPRCMGTPTIDRPENHKSI